MGEPFSQSINRAAISRNMPGPWSWCRLPIPLRIAALSLFILLQSGCLLDRGGPSLRSGGLIRPQLDRPSGSYHTVESGETLTEVAKSYGLDLKHLVEANNLREPYDLRPGEKIFVPGVSQTRRPDAEGNPPRAPHTGKPSRALSWPVQGTIVSRFRARTGTHYNGILLRASEGTVVNAAADGTVGCVRSIRGLGNLVLIEHADRLVTGYAHLKEVAVREGQSVCKGTVIGTVGASGRVDSPCLYFEVRSRSNPRDPLIFLESKG
jgi:lipoprotein NlpD